MTTPTTPGNGNTTPNQNQNQNQQPTDKTGSEKRSEARNPAEEDGEPAEGQNKSKIATTPTGQTPEAKTTTPTNQSPQANRTPENKA